MQEGHFPEEMFISPFLNLNKANAVLSVIDTSNRSCKRVPLNYKKKAKKKAIGCFVVIIVVVFIYTIIYVTSLFICFLLTLG